MKRKHRQPHRQQRSNLAQTPKTVPDGRWARSLALIVCIGTVAGGSWFMLKHFARSERDDQPPQLQKSALGVQSLTNGVSRLGPHSSNKNEAFGAQVNRGNELLAQGKAAEAVQVLTDAARMNPRDEDVHYDLALALTRQGNFTEAIKEYEEALRILPDYVEAHNNLGNVLMRTGHTSEAIQHFEAAIKIMPDYASAHNNLGTALQKTGQASEALAHFQQAVKSNPDYWEAHFNVGTSYLQAGRIQEAQAEFETVLRLRPDFQPAKAALAEIARTGASAPNPKP